MGALLFNRETRPADAVAPCPEPLCGSEDGPSDDGLARDDERDREDVALRVTRIGRGPCERAARTTGEARRVVRRARRGLNRRTRKL